MTRCDCHACRARDDRRFKRIIDAAYQDGYPRVPAARINANGYGRAAVLNLPPVPEWIGEPTEYEGGTL